MHNLKKVAFFHHAQRNEAEQTKILNATMRARIMAAIRCVY
jgi:hypothetical protein